MGIGGSGVGKSGSLQWLRGSLTRRVLGWMLLVSLLPLLVMAYQGYHCAGQALVEETQHHLDAIAVARGQQIEQWLYARQEDVDLLARIFEQGQPTDPQPVLDSFRTARSGFAWAARYGSDGRVLAVSAEPGVEVERLTGRGIPASGSGGRQSWESRGLWQLDWGRRTIDVNGNVTGFVGAGVDLKKTLHSLLANQPGLGPKGRLYIVSPNLTVLGVSTPSVEPWTLKADPSVLHLAMGHILHANHGFFHLLPVAPEVLRSAVPVAGTDWVLVAEEDPREALEWLGTLRWRATATGLVTLVVLMFVTFWIARSLGRPLRELARVAQRVRGGRTEERLGPMRGTEAEDVRQAFNRMLDDLREKQRELVRTATLASVGELSSSIVHEMRNPLSSIKMNLQALRRRADADPAHAELAEIAWEQLGRVEAMLDELLKYGRPVELHSQPTRFRDLADAALAVVSDAARAKGVTIDVGDGLNGRSIEVDREQMCRALTNLLLNAVQAAPAGSCVEFVGRAAELNGHVEIEILDTGLGLTPEMQDRLFKPFFTTKTDGTGLGLANVKKIVELHDGTVTARNRAEGGAAFTVRLPTRVASHRG